MLLRKKLLSIHFISESRSVSSFSPHPMPAPCCGFSLLVIQQQRARRPSLCAGCRREAGPAGKGDTPRVRSPIVVAAMVAAAMVAREMAVACLTRPPRAVTVLLMHAAARYCGSEVGRAERTTVNEFRRKRDSLCFAQFPCHPFLCVAPSPLASPLPLSPSHFSWVSVLCDCALTMWVSHDLSRQNALSLYLTHT